MKNHLPESTILGILKLIEVYEFYDQLCLFSCQNLSVQVYLALWIESSETEDVWLYTPVSSERFDNIKDGQVDLKSVFTHSEDAFVFEVSIPFDHKKQTTVKALACNDLTEDQLPEVNQFIQGKILK